MVFSANEFPRLGDNTYGMYRRLFPLRFNATFKREDPDFDPDIGEKLAREESIEYLCVLGVEGLRRVMAQHELSPNETSVKILADIEVDNSTIIQWIVAGNLTEDDIVNRGTQEVYNDYKEWCQENGVSFVGSRKFNGTLAARWHITPTGMGHGYRRGKRVTMRFWER
jgi:putative DNA primase/helicase